MASTFALSSIQNPQIQFSRTTPINHLGAVQRRRKETVNERVEHILRGALRDAQEEALQEREGGLETRGRAVQRSRQLASLYTTSTDSKFLRSRAHQDVSLQRSKEFQSTRDLESSLVPERSKAESEYGVRESNESDESDDETSFQTRLVLTSPIKSSVTWPDASSPSLTSPILKPWYGNSPTSTLKEQIAPGITLDAKLRRYGARGTAKLLYGWRSQEALEPLSPTPIVAHVEQFVSGLSGSPSLWPPQAFHPTGSNLRATMTRCPSSPVAISVSIPNSITDQRVNRGEKCQTHTGTIENLQHKSYQKLQKAHKVELHVEIKTRKQNQRDLAVWQTRTLHFSPSSELKAHREQQKFDPKLRHRRTQVSAIIQTPGYSPEKQRGTESNELKSKRFKLRWNSFAHLLDALRRTPCRRPVLQDMEKLFILSRELCALNALGNCMLSRSQFLLLIIREFPLCDVKHVNRLFSSYDWQIRDSVDARLILGAMRAMRVQQGDPVELLCSSLCDFDDTICTNAKGFHEALISTGACLVKTLTLCCASDEEEREMERRAEMIWTKTLAWQRQIKSRRLHGGVQYDVWKPSAALSSVSSSVCSRVTNSVDVVRSTGELKEREGDDEEENKEELPELIRLVEESRVPVRRIREALKRERETLGLFTEQLLQRRHECLVGATTASPRR